MTGADIDRMTARVYTAGRGPAGAAKRSAFWALLALAAVIAGAGVVADSTATVIGAMIVAPLMTPILGTTVGLVLAHRHQVVSSVVLVLAGALLVAAIGYALGLLVDFPVVAANNSQVAGRVSPRLIDLVAALATGIVGAFALVRPDVSDTLPGVAIAISLVPPLSVVGLTLESGAPAESFGALVLFGTNVAAIIATGTVILLAYRVRDVAIETGRPVGKLSGRTLVAVGGLVVLVTIPLTYGSIELSDQQQATAQARPVAQQWGERSGWAITELAYRQNSLYITALGLPPKPDEAALRQALNEAGLAEVDLHLSLVAGTSLDLPGGQPG
ncbi:DUF389 domain-containing protein [Pseudonocardia hispaniensis]|uniref:DUF389 domain-containing protein n=1 Tax=Pseudonocardia hispaniensis TaxID=904933 RepID=A0ABW1J6X7_9PSEU